MSIPNGATFWIRWTDTDATGADDGLAVDDFSLTPNAVPPVNLTINDVSLNEGNAGTTSFTFTVSLSAPAGPGGVTFDIATADGTATAPSDYTAKSLTGQTIPAGSSTYSFTVLVNGDTTPETNETFLVNVTNVTGATVTDGQGQGTIVNDDAAPNLTINDVSLSEGNAGTTTFTFTVSLSAPAPAGGVTFDIATADGTATAGSDYTAKSLTGQTIPAGSSTYTFGVLVNGDTTPEPDETFFVNVTNVANAVVTDGQGLGTIVNDDITKIHDVQGNGAATPIPGATVLVEGVVTANFQGANKLQGFFLQEEDADADADPNTSEGIFIFCGACATPVAEGQRVRVNGTVSESFGMTEITASAAGSVTVTDAANHLAEVTPAVINLPVVGDIDAFYEAREGMLVTYADTLTVSEYFELARFGQIVLYPGRPPLPVHREVASQRGGQHRLCGHHRPAAGHPRRRQQRPGGLPQPARRPPGRLLSAGQRRLLGRHSRGGLLPRRRPGQRPDRRPPLVLPRLRRQHLAHPPHRRAPGDLHRRQPAPGDPAGGRRRDQGRRDEPPQLLHDDRHHGQQLDRVPAARRAGRTAGAPTAWPSSTASASGPRSWSARSTPTSTPSWSSRTPPRATPSPTCSARSTPAAAAPTRSPS